jgi:hypothetical protein
MSATAKSLPDTLHPKVQQNVKPETTVMFIILCRIVIGISLDFLISIEHDTFLQVG